MYSVYKWTVVWTMPLLRFTCVFLGVAHVVSHPQCLDYRPPFEPKGELNFCSQYSEFGCCTQSKDQQLQSWFNGLRIKMQFSGTMNESCIKTAKELVCQECSPYAAHIYDAELTGIIRPMAGMCDDYCRNFYYKCGAVVPYLTSNPGVRQSLMSADAFCKNNALTDADYCYPNLLTNEMLNQDISQVQRTEEGCLCMEQFASGLRNPLLARTPPDGSGRIFIAEQLGIVHIYYKNGTKVAESFMDISDLVMTSTYRGDERGFLGLAFHPKFNNNSRFFIYFSIYKDSGQYVRISEFKVSASDINKVDPGSEKVLLDIKQPYWNHNGGEILFGVDGYLYLFVGDGGGAGDQAGNAQNKESLLGKVLRLDVDTPPSENKKAYTVPHDNPFVGEEKVHPEIYAYGIRNIWRCDVDEGHPETGYGRGRIICGDVGQSAYEEIDRIVKGGNFGWNGKEGYRCYDDAVCTELGSNTELPIYAYPHTVGKSVTGGHIYRGCQNPNLQGQYIYGDYVSGRLFRLMENRETNSTQAKWKNSDIRMCGSELCFNGLVGNYETHILSFGEDDDGEIYMLTTSFASTSSSNGKVYKLVDPRRRGDPTKCRSYKAPLNKSGMSTTEKLPDSSTPLLTTTNSFTPNTVVIKRTITDNKAGLLQWNGFLFLNSLIMLLFTHVYRL